MIGAGTLSVVRKAKPSDNGALAELYADSWRTAYRAIIPSTHLETMIRRRGVDWWSKAIRQESHLLVIEAAGKIAGYASCGTSRKPGVYNGEIYELYIAPVYQGGGLGEHLFEACRNELDRRGLDGLMVWALEDNEQAASFYWRRGGRPIGRSTTQFGKVKLGKIAYGWP